MLWQLLGNGRVTGTRKENIIDTTDVSFQSSPLFFWELWKHNFQKVNMILLQIQNKHMSRLVQPIYEEISKMVGGAGSKERQRVKDFNIIKERKCWNKIDRLLMKLVNVFGQWNHKLWLYLLPDRNNLNIYWTKIYKLSCKFHSVWAFNQYQKVSQRYIRILDH